MNIHGFGCGTLPDGSYECLCGQCGASDCTVCGKPHSEHGSYPTCATHPHTDDGRCGAVGTYSHGVFTGLPCPGAECVNGCVRALLAGGDQKAAPLHPSSVQAVDGDEPTDSQIWALAKRRIGFHQNRPDGRLSADNVDDVEIMSFARDVLAIRAAMKDKGHDN